MDADLAKAVEAYDAAQTRLDKTEADIRDNALQLEVTRQNLQLAQGELSNQLVADYRSGDADTIGVLLGAASMSDMLERIDIVKRSSGRTAQLVGKVLTLKKQFEARSKALAKQRKARAAALAERADRKKAIQVGIRARKDRLASVKADIRQIIREREAAERDAAAARAAAARAARAGAGLRRHVGQRPRHRRLVRRRHRLVRRLRRLRRQRRRRGSGGGGGGGGSDAPIHRRRRPVARRSCPRRSRSSAWRTAGRARLRARASTAPA